MAGGRTVRPTSVRVVDTVPASACPVDHRALAAAGATELSPLDRRMKRLLRLPVDGPSGSEASARRVFEVSIWISATRCLLTYIILPWVLPLVGVAKGWGPVLGLIVSPIAIVFNVLSIRRFHRSGHRYRWPISAVNATIIVLLVILVIRDLVDLLS